MLLRKLNYSLFECSNERFLPDSLQAPCQVLRKKDGPDKPSTLRSVRAMAAWKNPFPGNLHEGRRIEKWSTKSRFESADVQGINQ
jgi:hypothetical protein